MVFAEESGVVVYMVIIVAIYKEDMEDVEDTQVVLFQTITVKVVIVVVIFVKVL